MIWKVPSDPTSQTFSTREAAVARAWELTAPGGRRPEPYPVEPDPKPSPLRAEVDDYDLNLKSVRHETRISIADEDPVEVVSFSGDVIMTPVHKPTVSAEIEVSFPYPSGTTSSYINRLANKMLELEASARGMRIASGVAVDITFDMGGGRRKDAMMVVATARAIAA